MNFKDQVRADLETLLGGEFAEDVEIEGAMVSAVVSRDAAPESGNELASEGSSARATVFLSAKEVDKPQRGDVVKDSGGVVWKVVQVRPLPGAYSLLCVSEENPWG
jgi:hypothetical protein